MRLPLALIIASWTVSALAGQPADTATTAPAVMLVSSQGPSGGLPFNTVFKAAIDSITSWRGPTL